MKLKRRLRCSFCSRSESEVEKLIAGPKVHICESCVGICNRILEATPKGSGDWATMTDGQLLAALKPADASLDAVRSVLRAQVDTLRRRGVSWSQIGDALGVSARPPGSDSPKRDPPRRENRGKPPPLKVARALWSIRSYAFRGKCVEWGIQSGRADEVSARADRRDPARSLLGLSVALSVVSDHDRSYRGGGRQVAFCDLPISSSSSTTILGSAASSCRIMASCSSTPSCSASCVMPTSAT